MVKKGEHAALFQFTPLREGRHSCTLCASAFGAISIHAPPRGATCPARLACACLVFQFTPLREGRPRITWRRRRTAKFQFTPLREGRLAGSACDVSRHYFNSRPSARGDAPPDSHLRRVEDFNSRPSARGDPEIHFPETIELDISIHAPPRGATGGGKACLKRSEFQFTPLREGRQAAREALEGMNKFQFTPLREGRRALPRRTSNRLPNFNSRPSARGDSRCGGLRGEAESISIHAPPRGATTLGALLKTEREKFQFTPLREGRQHADLIVCDDVVISIHDPPRGATTKRLSRNSSRRNFNSRPSARGDPIVPLYANDKKQFQFTPLREGRRRCRGRTPRADVISIHAPPRGATPMACLRAEQARFQFTPLREGRRKGINTAEQVSLFQFTPLREGRRARA